MSDDERNTITSGFLGGHGFAVGDVVDFSPGLRTRWWQRLWDAIRFWLWDRISGVPPGEFVITETTDTTFSYELRPRKKRVVVQSGAID